MKLVVDTSALLSLACSNYFEILLKENKFIITNSVLEELKTFTIYDDFLGTKAKEILKKEFKIKNPIKLIDLNLEKTEIEVFSLALEEKCLSLTDDIHAARVAKSKLSLDVKPSFYLILELYKRNKIKKSDLIKDIKLILNNRNWLNSALGEYFLQILESIK